MLVSSNIVAAWLVPAGLIVLGTLGGWIVEQLAMRWVRSIVRHVTQRQQSVIAGALRGHITFWGFLVGVGLAYDTLYTLYYSQKNATAQKNVAGLPTVLFSPNNQQLIQNSLLALFVVSLSLMLSRIIIASIVASSASASRPVVSLVTNVTRFIVLAIGFMLVLSVYGINITPWLTTLGVAGLAVSLALTATLTDLVSGVLLLASHQIKIGEFIKLSTGEEGYITDITWRTTTLRQLNDNDVIVPNAKMTTLPVTNLHANTQEVIVTVDLGVAYTADLGQVERVTLEVASEVQQHVPGGVADFTPLVRFNAFSEYSIRVSVTLKAQSDADQLIVKHEFIKRLSVRYKAEGIAIPYPISSVQLNAPEQSSSVSMNGQPSAALGGGQASANSSDASSR
jgi:small-conductance mechanosensitive channel